MSGASDPLDDIIRSDARPEVVEYAPAGEHDAVLVDWFNEGGKEGLSMLHGRMLPCVRLSWQIAARKLNGRRFLVTKRYHKTLGPRSELRKIIEAWRGRPLTTTEARTGIMLEYIINQPCRILLTNVPWGEDKRWVDVVSLTPWDVNCGRFALQPESVLRYKDPKPPWYKARAQQAQAQQQP